MPKRPSERATIIGIVTACQWNKNNEVVAIMIATGGEKEYIVSPGREGSRLYRHIREEVSATGSIYQDSDGTYHIEVESFDPINRLERRN